MGLIHSLHPLIVLLDYGGVGFQETVYAQHNYERSGEKADGKQDPSNGFCSWIHDFPLVAHLWHGIADNSMR